MPVNFLCAKHREILFANKPLAEHYWMRWITQAAQYHEDDDIEPSIPLLGCAWEVTDHLLTHSWPNQATALARYTAASICLAKTFDDLGNLKASTYYMHKTQRRVAELVTDIRCYQYITNSIYQLNLAGAQQAIQRWYKGLVPSPVVTHQEQLLQRRVALH